MPLTFFTGLTNILELLFIIVFAVHTYIHTKYIHLLIIIKHTCAAVLLQRKIRDFSAPSSMFVCMCVLILDVWTSACVRALSCMCVPVGVCMLCECVCLFRFLLPFPF